MNVKFFDLSKEKQDIMINGALKVFEENGYQHASTDDMVKEAGVSKGLWFHYFGSKLGLYSFVYDYSVKYMTMEMNRSVDKNTSNYIDIGRQSERARISIMRSYPYMHLFLCRAQEEKDPEVLAETLVQRGQYEQLLWELSEGADWSQVDPRILQSRVEKMMRATLDDLYKQRFKDQVFSIERLQDEVDGYFDMMAYMLKRR